jgi:zinc/manganese transport system ATP-binding protein
VGGFGEIGKAALTKVREALEIVGLQGFESRALGTLSSGQLQRVLFARLLVQDAELILLDEPFNAVDTKTTAALLAMVTRWNQEKRTVVAVLHDETQVLQNFPQTLMLARELVDWGPSSQVLTPKNFKKAQAMSEAWDEQAEFCKHNV